MSMFKLLALVFLSCIASPVCAQDLRRFQADVRHVQLLLDELDYTDAVDSADIAIKSYGEERPIFRYLKGRALQELGRNQKAVVEFSAVIDSAIAQKRMYSQMVEVYRARAMSYLRLQKPEEAIKDLNNAIRLNPHLGLTQLELAMADKQANNYQGVVNDVTAALKVGIDVPMSFRAYNARAWAYDHLNKPDLAKADRDKVVALQKKFIE